MLFQQLEDGVYFPNAAQEPLVDTTAVARMVGYKIIAALLASSQKRARTGVCLSPTPKPFWPSRNIFQKMDNYWRVTSVTSSATAECQPGVPVLANHSATPSATSSLSSTDATILAADIVSLQA